MDEFGVYRTIISSDQKRFGGNTARVKSYKSHKEAVHGRDYQIRVDIPPLGGLYLKLKK